MKQEKMIKLCGELKKDTTTLEENSKTQED